MTEQTGAQQRVITANRIAEFRVGMTFDLHINSIVRGREAISAIHPAATQYTWPITVTGTDEHKCTVRDSRGHIGLHTYGGELPWHLMELVQSRPYIGQRWTRPPLTIIESTVEICGVAEAGYITYRRSGVFATKTLADFQSHFVPLPDPEILKPEHRNPPDVVVHTVECKKEAAMCELVVRTVTDDLQNRGPCYISLANAFRELVRQESGHGVQLDPVSGRPAAKGGEHAGN